MVINAKALPGSILSIRANANTATESVSFGMTGELTHTRIETGPPFSLFGDTGHDYNGQQFGPGMYQLTVLPFSDSGLGNLVTISFILHSYECDLQSEIPVDECRALVAFYYKMAGTGWTNDTDWLQTTTPCS